MELMQSREIGAGQSPLKRGGVRSDWADSSDMERVAALMGRLAVGTRLERTGAMVQEHLQAGGKRVRARLALAVADALGAEPGVAVGWASAVELLHNATLVHDDVQDGDRVRRGRPTLWVRHGVAQAINAGDLMLMLPFQAVGQVAVDDATRWRLCAAVARRAAETVRGQCQELGLLGQGDLGRDGFDAAVAGKTGALMALPVEGAALIAGFAADDARRLGDAFVALGGLFQLQDDVLDLFGDKGRGRVGCDLEEGKVSALVVAHLALHPGDRDWLLDLLRRPREETSPEDVAVAIQRFVSGGALGRVLDRIDDIERAVAHHPDLLAQPAVHRLALELARLATLPIRHVRA